MAARSSVTKHLTNDRQDDEVGENDREAITPAELRPPDHSTAASGTLPTEQTKLSTAMTGPMSAPHIVCTAAGRVVEEEAVEEVVAEQRDEAGQQEADE